MNRTCILYLLFFVTGCNHPETKQYERNQVSSANLSDNKENLTNNGYKVVGVKDGDTFVLLIDGKEQVVRLAHIDCPEKNQPFGTNAKQFVSQICFGKYITLIHNNKYDRNKRLIAEVILPDATNLNKELVNQGLAWHFKRYSNDNTYADLELIARHNKVGLWSENLPIPPWQWRK